MSLVLKCKGGGGGGGGGVTTFLSYSVKVCTNIFLIMNFKMAKTACKFKRTNSTLVVHKMALGRRRGHPKELSVNKTVCYSSRNMFIFSVPSTY